MVCNALDEGCSSELSTYLIMHAYTCKDDNSNPETGSKLRSYNGTLLLHEMCILHSVSLKMRKKPLHMCTKFYKFLQLQLV